MLRYLPPMAEEAYRTERDSMGEVRVPAHAKWGAQTHRAVENFPISGMRALPPLNRNASMISGLRSDLVFKPIRFVSGFVRAPAGLPSRTHQYDATTLQSYLDVACDAGLGEYSLR